MWGKVYRRSGPRQIQLFGIRCIGVQTLVLAVGLCSRVTLVCAGDFRDEPVGARISMAKDRILLFTDAVARQASAAFPFASSTNPAADDFVRHPPADYDGYGLGLTSNAFFDNGTHVTGLSGIGSVRLPNVGTVTAALVRLDSHDGTSRQRDEFVLRSNEVILGYSHHLSKDLAIGVEALFTDSTLKIQTASSQASSDTFGVGFNLGVIVALDPTVTLGVHGGVKWDRTHTDGLVTLPAPAVSFRLRDTAEVGKVRAGVGWRPTSQLGFYADLEYVHLEDRFGTTEVGRIYVGGEYFPTSALAVRLGGVVDTFAEAGVAAGLGYYGFQGVPIELAYTYNTFPEVRHEFGRAHLLSLSIVFLF